jgi:hypothetical protein
MIIAIVIVTTVISGVIGAINVAFEKGDSRSWTEPYLPGETFPGNFDDYDDFRDFFNDYYQSGTGSRRELSAEDGAGLWGGDDAHLRRRQPAFSQDIYEKCSASIVAITSRISGEEYSWGTGIIMRTMGTLSQTAMCWMTPTPPW